MASCLTAWRLLGGDYRCDFVVGDSVKRVYRFIEFEDAKKNSIFEKRGKKSNREWSRRFIGGYTQIVDWFWVLEDLAKSTAFATLFGVQPISYDGLLVIGRDKHQDLRETSRLHFFRENHPYTKITCLTFDELLYSLRTRLDMIGLAKSAEAP